MSVLARGRYAGAYTYIACPNATAEGLRPFDWYLAYVLAGARRHGLPGSYIQTLLNIKSIADRNTARRGKLPHFAQREVPDSTSSLKIEGNSDYSPLALLCFKPKHAVSV